MNAIQQRLEGLANNGVFGKGKLLQILTNHDADFAPQFASELKFFKIEMELDSETSLIPIVVKTQPEAEEARATQHSDLQFLTEVTTYNQIFPFLNINMNMIPKILYGEATDGKDPKKDIVILGDLSDEGFKTTKNVFLDYNHVALTLRTLGEFHGQSYKMKNTNRQTLLSLGKSFWNRSKAFTDDSSSMFFHFLQRGFKPAAEKTSKGKIKIQDVIKRIESIGWPKLYYDMRSPLEPFAAVIHGDFNKNNFMYKYNTNKEVQKVKFVDFQNSMYSDPSLDLSFFLYMNTSQSTRDEHWDDFMKIYWKGVTSVEPDPGFSFDGFTKNFARKAIYGYFFCSFFLPMMLDPDNIKFEEELSIDKRLEKWLNIAGETGTEAVCNIAEDLLKRGYLDEFLHTFK